MGKVKQSGRTNEDAYATYRHYVEPDIHDVAVRRQEQECRLTLDEQFTLIMLAGSWSARYFRRMEAIDRWKIDNLDPGLADTEAKEILVARHRAHNVQYKMPPEFTEQQVAECNRSTILNGKDISSLTDIPSYGPSLISLWEDAKASGLSYDDAADRLEEWRYYTPPAWARDDERKRKKLAAIDKSVQTRLKQCVVWQRTGDLFIPWNSQVDGHKWEIRINDFPDEYMYSLLIDGTAVGDFHDWPETWGRSAIGAEGKSISPVKAVVTAPSAVVMIDATKLLTRYEAGECEAVWRDLMAMGADVRKPADAAAADSVVRETMRRLRHNFELIVKRLKSIDYQFHGGVWEAPELREDPELIASCEHEGLFLPLSLKTFVMEFGAISLLGSHPVLAPEGIETDALMLGGPQLLDGTLEQWIETDTEDRESIVYEVSPDAASKVSILDGELPNVLLGIQLPNESADAILQGEPEGRTLVEYLRWNFQWGGFPGWEKHENRPERELAFLREGLLPV